MSLKISSRKISTFHPVYLIVLNRLFSVHLKLNTMVVLDPNNSTAQPLFPAERYFVLTYHIIIIISSLVGDTIILVASIKHGAIKLHKFIVALIEHIAVCDLTLNLFYVLPGAISLGANRWIFGNFLLCLRVYVTWYSFTASLYFVCALTSSKLYLLTRPQRSSSLSGKSGHVISAGIWVISGYMPTLFLLTDWDDVEFDNVSGYGEYQYRAAVWSWLVPVSAVLVGVVPNIITLISTVCIIRYLVKARKVARSCRSKVVWHGLMTVVVTAVVSCLSSVPMATFFVTERLSLLKGETAAVYELISRYLTLLNVTSNFFIYYFTVPSFRKFLKEKVSLRRLSSRHTLTHEGESMIVT